MNSYGHFSLRKNIFIGINGIIFLLLVGINIFDGFTGRISGITWERNKVKSDFCSFLSSKSNNSADFYSASSAENDVLRICCDKMNAKKLSDMYLLRYDAADYIENHRDIFYAAEKIELRGNLKARNDKNSTPALVWFAYKADDPSNLQFVISIVDYGWNPEYLFDGKYGEYSDVKEMYVSCRAPLSAEFLEHFPDLKKIEISEWSEHISEIKKHLPKNCEIIDNRPAKKNPPNSADFFICKSVIVMSAVQKIVFGIDNVL